MRRHGSRKPDWPRKVTLGRVSVSIYKRTAPNGSPCFLPVRINSAFSWEAGHRKLLKTF